MIVLVESEDALPGVAVVTIEALESPGVLCKRRKPAVICGSGGGKSVGGNEGDVVPLIPLGVTTGGVWLYA